MDNTRQSEPAFIPYFNRNIMKGQDRRTATVNALCSTFGYTPSRLKEIIEYIVKRAYVYNSEKAKATCHFLLNNNSDYNDIMTRIDVDYNLLDYQWFILKEFRESIQLIELIY